MTWNFIDLKRSSSTEILPSTCSYAENVKPKSNACTEKQNKKRNKNKHSTPTHIPTPNPHPNTHTPHTPNTHNRKQKRKKKRLNHIPRTQITIYYNIKLT